MWCHPWSRRSSWHRIHHLLPVLCHRLYAISHHHGWYITEGRRPHRHRTAWWCHGIMRQCLRRYIRSGRTGTRHLHHAPAFPMAHHRIAIGSDSVSMPPIRTGKSKSGGAR